MHHTCCTERICSSGLRLPVDRETLLLGMRKDEAEFSKRR